MLTFDDDLKSEIGRERAEAAATAFMALQRDGREETEGIIRERNILALRGRGKSIRG